MVEAILWNAAIPLVPRLVHTTPAPVIHWCGVSFGIVERHAARGDAGAARRDSRTAPERR